MLDTTRSSVEKNRAQVGKLLLITIWLLGLISAVVAFVRGIEPILIATLALAIAGGATVTWLRLNIKPVARFVTSMSISAQTALLVLSLDGHAYQIDAHMVFFAGLAICALWTCWRSIIFAGGVVAIHHLTLNFMYPAAIYPGGSDLIRTLIHAVVLIVEVAFLAWIVHRQEYALKAADRSAADAVEAMQLAETLAESNKNQTEQGEVRRAAIMTEVGRFRATIATITQYCSSQVLALSGTAEQLTITSGSTQKIAAIARSNADESAANVSSVASAAEELNSSIGELRRQTELSLERAGIAHQEVKATNDEIGQLTQTAERINAVVDIINGIAKQTNLLALNATIEAARAGEIGKGFSVVASEVKVLADQTARATVDISEQLAGIQSGVAGAVAAIARVNLAVSEVRESTQTVAFTINQQDGATAEIANSMVGAAQSSQIIVSGMDEVANAASATHQSADEVVAAAKQMRAMADNLSQEVEDFLTRVAA